MKVKGLHPLLSSHDLSNELHYSLEGLIKLAYQFHLNEELLSINAKKVLKQVSSILIDPDNCTKTIQLFNNEHLSSVFEIDSKYSGDLAKILKHFKKLIHDGKSDRQKQILLIELQLEVRNYFINEAVDAKKLDKLISQLPSTEIEIIDISPKFYAQCLVIESFTDYTQSSLKNNKSNFSKEEKAKRKDVTIKSLLHHLEKSDLCSKATIEKIHTILQEDYET